MELPKHILKSLRDNATSLGDHPAFPPEEEEKFVILLMRKTFSELSEKLGMTDYDELKKQLGSLIVKCKKLERNNRAALEELCGKVVNDLFKIPRDCVEISSELTDTIDTSSQNMLPQKTENFTFDDIDDIKSLTNDIYKRRMLNALVAGASMYCTNYIGEYVKEIFNINPDLPALYKKVLNYNNVLMFIEKDKLNDKNSTEAGKVDVTISSSDTLPIIKAEALLFPILVEETIKGLLELSISHGLPKSREKAKYVVSKSDFKLAELWDTRLGFALWKRIEEQVSDSGYDMKEVGINFFLMTLSEMEYDEFNSTLQEIFLGTRKGKEILSDICDDILYRKEKDDFDDYIQTKNGELVRIDDEEDFTPDELLADELFTSDEELITDSYYA